MVTIHMMKLVQKSTCAMYAFEVATISRLPKNIGRSLLQKSRIKGTIYSAKETSILKEPTDHSHPISQLSNTMYFNLLSNTLKYMVWGGYD